MVNSLIMNCATFDYHKVTSLLSPLKRDRIDIKKSNDETLIVTCSSHSMPYFELALIMVKVLSIL